MDLHGFVEPCTIANLQEMDVDCEACSTSHATPDRCSHDLGARGFEKRCTARGDSSGWSEVWCKKRRLESEATEKPTETPANPVPIVVGVGALAGGLLLVRYWRRPAKQ